MKKMVVNGNGTISIPIALRRKYGLKRGTFVHVIDQGGVLVIVPVRGNAVETAAGSLLGGPALGEALRKTRRKETGHGR